MVSLPGVPLSDVCMPVTLMDRDRIYSLPQQRVGDFAFDEQVVRVFPDMIARSVPGYASILSMIEQLAVRFVQPGSRVYDLGCSLGAATMLIRRQAPPDCTIHAVDNSAAMISRLQTNLDAEPAGGCPVELHQTDLREMVISRASLVVLNLTLQFVPVDDRVTVLKRVYDGLLPGGALLLSEKVCFQDTRQQHLMTDLHHDFKRAHGYSDLEIAQKRTAIENRLIPETLEAHTDRLRAVGFSTVAPWFQCFNFVSILAVRSEAA
ncbi:MAG: carboxy-S-adenosyl-L-methionine synthase CmoA [Planctomycetaceae bacterium]|nr:carboxy-S-adenosyl-L-methionine synthase CmoA [Planctomycetaceae bacterium]